LERDLFSGEALDEHGRRHDVPQVPKLHVEYSDKYSKWIRQLKYREQNKSTKTNKQTDRQTINSITITIIPAYVIDHSPASEEREDVQAIRPDEGEEVGPCDDHVLNDLDVARLACVVELLSTARVA
jgi:hypothetical protein